MAANDQNDPNEETGGLAGLGAGVLAGASLGTALIPIPVIGTFAGALVGGLLGSQVGKTVGGAVLGAINPTPRASTTVHPEAASEPQDPNYSYAQPATGSDMLAQLERLSSLRSQGLITEEEFKAAKSQLLGL